MSDSRPKWLPQEIAALSWPWEKFKEKFPGRSRVAWEHKRRRVAQDPLLPLEDQWRCPYYTKCEKIEGDVVVTGDWHIPFTDWELAGDVIRVGEFLGIKQLLIAGDLFDFEALSFFIPEDDEIPTLEVEFDLAGKAIDELHKWFTSIIMTKGNHERRILAKLSAKLEMSRFQKLFTNLSEDVVFSDYPYCLIDTPTGIWRATHPRNYSQVKLAVATRMADIHSTQNIINHHGHFAGGTLAKDGKRACIDNGCLADPHKVAYKQLNDTTHPEWNQGFGALKHGVWLARTVNPRLDVLGLMMGRYDAL